LAEFGLRIQGEKIFPAKKKKYEIYIKYIYSKMKSKQKVWKEIYENLLISKEKLVFVTGQRPNEVVIC
jgi:hypothetical protein